MYIKVKVIANSKKETFRRKSPTEFDIMVREPAERNLANKRVRELIANEFNIREKDVKILTGHRSPTKMLSIEL